MMVGRLAPSPTGILHAGNLFSAAIAAAHVVSHGGQLILRIEDIDTPRCVPGAAELMVRHLRWLGLEWHAGPDTAGGPGPWFQSERTHLYEQAFNRLQQSGLLYPCTCSRKDIDDVLSAPHGLPPGMEYPNLCDALGAPPESERRQQPHAWRFRSRGEVSFRDGVCGEVHERLDDRGDFVVRRRDKLFAYQLAVVVDDMTMGVTSVVRGRDLLDSTGRQIALWRALGGSPPAWMHVPLVVHSDGQRLSKRDAAMGADGLAERGWTGPLMLGAFSAILNGHDSLNPLTIELFAKELNIQSLVRPFLTLPNAFFESPTAFDAWLTKSPMPSKDPE